MLRRYTLAAAVTSLPVLLHGAVVLPLFDGLYGQDPYAYLAYAVGPLRDWLGSGGPLPPFHWPPGFPLLVALASLLVGPTARAGQLVALLAAATVPPATVVLARGLDLERRAALLAGGVAGLTGQLWQSGVVVMSDAPALAAVTWGAAAVVWWSRPKGGRRPWPLLAGAAALGVAILCRWAAGLAALPVVALAVAAAVRRPFRHGAAQLLAAGAVGAAVLAPVLGPAVDALAGSPREGPSFTVDLEVVGWSPAHVVMRRFENADGIQRHRWPNLAFYGVAPARRAMLGPIGALLLVPGLAAVLCRPRLDRLLLVAWPATVLGFLAGMSYQSFRFVLPALPPLAVLAGIGADRLLAAASGRMQRLAAIVLVAAAAWMVWGGVSLTRFLVLRARATHEVVERVVASVPADALVLAFNVTLALEHDGRVDVLELYHQDPTSLAALLAEGRPLFLVADLDVVRGQWRDLSPGAALRWLEARARLEPRWTLHGRTLVEVAP